MTGLTALGAGVALSAAFAASASAAPETDAAAACSAVAVENRAVWAAPGTGEGTVGAVTASRTYTADCSLTEGESYTACGSTGDLWAHVNHAGEEWGYLPSACLNWAS
ncbi:MAG TPA: hypothetical protein VKZ65_14365 [Glycomyces sp.]|nr:hypothetical protein [Glycomyces sp.]